MIRITLRSGLVDPSEATYQYQEEPKPGGLLFTLIVSGADRDVVAPLCQHILSGGEDQVPMLLASVTDIYTNWREKRYVLNTVCTIEIGEEHILLEAVGSPLVAEWGYA